MTDATLDATTEPALDPIQRARILAVTVPGAGYTEAVFDVPFAEAWPRLADLEHSVPTADRLLRRLRIRRRRALPDGAEELRFTTVMSFGLPVPFTARLEPGWCLMQAPARAFVVVMAARAEGDRTRYGHLEAVPWRAAGIGRRFQQAMVESDVRGFERVAGGTPGTSGYSR